MGGYPKAMHGIAYRLERRSKIYLKEVEGARKVFHVKQGFLIALFPSHTRIIDSTRPSNEARARRRLQGFPLPKGWRAHIHVQGAAGSGKTWLADCVSAALGASAHPMANNFTEAGLRQAMTGTALATVLDEVDWSPCPLAFSPAGPAVP